MAGSDRKPVPLAKNQATTRIVCKTAAIFFAATWLILAVNIPSAFSFFNPFIVESFNPLGIYRIYDPMLKDTDRLATFRPDAEVPAYGKILSPSSGSRRSRVIRIIGMTANIPQGHYILLAVDIAQEGVFYPKWPFIAPNTAFMTEIYDGRPAGEYSLSLYVVDAAYYRKIYSWFKQEKVEGMPFIPARYKLDEVKVRLEKK
ncbi:MAG: hypothetical protein PVJ53_16690 [Desulfobacterales bacterium]|jgi:hypothetical protein